MTLGCAIGLAVAESSSARTWILSILSVTAIAMAFLLIEMTLEVGMVSRQQIDPAAVLAGEITEDASPSDRRVVLSAASSLVVMLVVALMASVARDDVATEPLLEVRGATQDRSDELVTVAVHPSDARTTVSVDGATRIVAEHGGEVQLLEPAGYSVITATVVASDAGEVQCSIERASERVVVIGTGWVECSLD